MYGKVLPCSYTWSSLCHDSYALIQDRDIEAEPTFVPRWHNHLNPKIKRDAWTIDEELTIIRAHEVHGNKWAEIAKVLPGRSSL